MKRIIPIIFLSGSFFLACSVTKNDQVQFNEMNKLQTSIDSLKNELSTLKNHNRNQISTFLTFQDGNAEKAMNFYVSLFDNSKILDVQRWGKEGPVEEGKIMFASFALNGKTYRCSDSPPIHNWDFSPAVSNYVECKNETELKGLYTKLSKNGTVTMPLNNYGFSQKFAWVIDQYGVSWQLNFN